MVAVSEDWVWNSRDAATVKEPDSATARKQRKWRREIFLISDAVWESRSCGWGDGRDGGIKWWQP
jgi:hypothetical protein